MRVSTDLGRQITKLRLSTTIAVLAVPLLLGGCANDGYGIEALKAPAGPEDVVPEGVNLPFLEEIDASTLRFLVEDDGRQYFAAQSADGAMACVAVFYVDQQLGGYGGCGAAVGSSAAAGPAPESLRSAMAIQRFNVVTEARNPSQSAPPAPRPCGPHQ